MARRKSKVPKRLAFRDKLILNQWIIRLFGIDPLNEHADTKPFHLLSSSLKEMKLEGLDNDNLHYFYHALTRSDLLGTDYSVIKKEDLREYEENIARHTLAINEKRRRPVVWKYYQWLTLLFTEIYLDRFFSDKEGMLMSLNNFVEEFNRRHTDWEDAPLYEIDDLNKLCLQNATGSGKTLLMHVNLLQYRDYAQKHGKEKELSRVILLTPNERLSEQHIEEFEQSGINARSVRTPSEAAFIHSRQVDTIEITKLGDREGPGTISARSLGDNNLLLVDEGHRGLSGTGSGKTKNSWLKNRAMLCAKGFAFEYSATFEQAVKASRNIKFENSYAKSIIFDYSYRWFYEDGFGKDYRILNMPKSFEKLQRLYLTACLLKFYQQLRVYEEKSEELRPFNLEKPLWVFVGGTVSGGKLNKTEKMTATDVARIILFIAGFLADDQKARDDIKEILTSEGRSTGLLDKEGNDIFGESFSYLMIARKDGEIVETLHRDILRKLFQSKASGRLHLERVKGDSGETALRVGSSETPFGLINVGDAKGLCDHIEQIARRDKVELTVRDSDFSEAMFASVKNSDSPINLLIGSKKFVEGWDCWRVGTMGLMRVGRNEGAQIIQLFGRGVRLKGWQWSLKRSGRADVARKPEFIDELETLNVFGIEADFMEKFRDFLKEEGLPGNERVETFQIPLSVTHDFGKKLKIVRPKRKVSDGQEYDFKKDGRAPTLGKVPEYILKNKIEVDWYSRVEVARSIGSDKAAEKDAVSLKDCHLAFIDYDELFLELERFKRERGWRNLNISAAGIEKLLKSDAWYTLRLPESKLNPTNFESVSLIRQVAGKLLKDYCERYYKYRERSYIEPRLELCDLDEKDDNLPREEFYRLIVDGDEAKVIEDIKKMQSDLKERKGGLFKHGHLRAYNFDKHLFEPLFHIRSVGKVTVRPVSLNESEFQFVSDLKEWSDRREDDGRELYLLRNLSRGKGVGFFEAGNFHPDFILWLLAGDKQHIAFIEPHGLKHEGLGGEKLNFYKRVKEIEKRLGDSDVTIDCFILSWSTHGELEWIESKEELENKHIFFMKDDKEFYIDKMLERLTG